MNYNDLSYISEKELLETPLSKLRLDIVNCIHSEQVIILTSLLKKLGIQTPPRFWISSEWFSPDGSYGFAIPFYLFHPRLLSLELKHTKIAEGKTKTEFFKLIKHESAHAIDNGFGLRKLKKRQKLFGLSSQKYPTNYIPNKNTNDFVQSLPDFYAQAHPEEDWAETFSVFLTSKNSWMKKYKGTLAVEKLLYMESVFNKIQNKKLKLDCTDHQSIRNDSRTLREYYREKTESYKLNQDYFFSNKDISISSSHSIESNTSQVLSAHIKLLKTKLVKNFGLTPHVSEKMTQDLIKACKKNNFQLKYNLDKSIELLSQDLKRYEKQFKRQGRHRVIM